MSENNNGSIVGQPSNQFAQVMAAFDAANAEDPNRDDDNGTEIPRELLYGWRMSACLEAFKPQASEALKLAARCQHIRRWAIPRSDYPQNKQGYHRWRQTLRDFHAETAGEILRNAGYDQTTIDRVGVLLRKQGLKQDPEVQCLEDVICLVFLKHYLDEFAARHSEDKVVEILRKTSKKMSPRGQQAAQALDLPAASAALLTRALAAPG